MSPLNGIWLAIVCFLYSASASPMGGSQVSDEEIRVYFSIPPSGVGLPKGSGNAVQGGNVYELKCAMCHGKQLEGVPASGGPALIGGRNSLKSTAPIKTVESYWPYATTLFDYIWRAMPFFSPGSLTPDEVYAVCAFILASGKVIGSHAVMNADSLPNVRMPNANGFYEDSEER